MISILSAIIIATSVLAAFMIIRKENVHYRTLTESLRFVNEVKNTAMLYNKAFEDIVKDIQHNESFRYLDIINIFCNDTSSLPVPEKWRIAVERSKCNMRQWERDVLIKFCNSLCTCSKEDIASYGEAAASELKQFAECSVERKDKHSKTGAVFAVSAGIIAVLLII